MTVRIDPLWGEALIEEFGQPYFADLIEFVRKEYQTDTIYPLAKIFLLPLIIALLIKSR